MHKRNTPSSSMKSPKLFEMQVTKYRQLRRVCANTKTYPRTQRKVTQTKIKVAQAPPDLLCMHVTSMHAEIITSSIYDKSKNKDLSRCLRSHAHRSIILSFFVGVS